MTRANLTPDERRELVLRAIDKADLSKFHTRADKEMAVVESMLFINRLLDETSLPNRVIKAVPLTGVVKKLEFEESSQRFMLTFEADQGTGDKRDETIRTDRVDGATGPVVRKKFTNDLVGRRCLIFKETVVSSSDPNKKVRIVPYIKVIV